jgi:hypothetical protein
LKSYSIFLFFLLFLIGCNLSSAETNFSGSGEYWEANFIGSANILPNLYSKYILKITGNAVYSDYTMKV